MFEVRFKIFKWTIYMYIVLLYVHIYTYYYMYIYIHITKMKLKIRMLDMNLKCYVLEFHVVSTSVYFEIHLLMEQR